MTDQELLESAAKAAGVTIRYNCMGTQNANCVWDPLEDDGDALRLAVNLKLAVGVLASDTTVESDEYDTVEEMHRQDPNAATRRAIVRAAAEIGKGTK